LASLAAASLYFACYFLSYFIFCSLSISSLSSPTYTTEYGSSSKFDFDDSCLTNSGSSAYGFGCSSFTTRPSFAVSSSSSFWTWFLGLLSPTWLAIHSGLKLNMRVNPSSSFGGVMKFLFPLIMKEPVDIYRPVGGVLET
jgi:hypothetical protein